jgi:hypothetical protein
MISYSIGKRLNESSELTFWRRIFMNKETCSNNYIAKNEHQSFEIIGRPFLQI